MTISSFAPLINDLEEVRAVQRFGLVSAMRNGLAEVKGLSKTARVGDLVSLEGGSDTRLGEVLASADGVLHVLTAGGLQGTAIGQRVLHLGHADLRPDTSWVGRVLDAFGKPLDGKPLTNGPRVQPVRAQPPEATSRRKLGAQIETGMAALNTFLPLVRGQRMGLFAGSGVGKSTLLAQLAQGIEADFSVIALIGERGREVREFVDDTLGPEGLKKSIVVAATSDQSPIERRRAAWTAMAIAEYLRDQGAHVLFLADSITRFCDAHREIAVSAGEAASLAGYPASTSQTVMGLCERAGPGAEGQGDITAIFSVLVAGSNMEEPIADLVRGVLDGHIILDREIAERGRFPAIDILRSVSRSFEKALASDQQDVVAKARALLSAYKEAEIMIQAGLYKSGADAVVDKAIQLRPKLESFLATRQGLPFVSVGQHFQTLQEILGGPNAKGITV
jgi:flagellum-specific ATP synthase